jgi:hypothetical protein
MRALCRRCEAALCTPGLRGTRSVLHHIPRAMNVAISFIVDRLVAIVGTELLGS